MNTLGGPFEVWWWWLASEHASKSKLFDDVSPSFFAAFCSGNSRYTEAAYFHAFT
jgi:hypothetical protein